MKNYTAQDLWFVFQQNTLLVKQKEQAIAIPCMADIQHLDLKLQHEIHLGEFNGQNCYAAELAQEISEFKGISFEALKQLMDVLEEKIFLFSGRAFQILHWEKNHRYCGRCGNPTQTKADERAKICTKCGMISYPQICPAIIVAVIKDEEILLVHNRNFPAHLYSVIAGFVDPGETLEECVKREVYEEVGIKVKNIRYFGSQPWSFPNTLMAAFTAEYAGGEVKADQIEILDAGWFKAEHLPMLPSKHTIARKMIDSFVSSIGKNTGSFY